MKRTIIFLQLLLAPLLCLANDYIRLSDGAVVSDRQEAKPQRTIEDVDDGILVTYQFDYVVKRQDDLYPSCSVLSLNGFVLNGEAMAPSIPLRFDKFVIPDPNLYNVSIVDSSFIEIPLEIAPARPPLFTNDDHEYTTDNVKPVAPFDGYFPANTIFSEANSFRNSFILDVRVTPVQYNYTNRKVRICRRLSYLINFNQPDMKKSKEMVLKSLETDPVVANSTLNPRSKRETQNRETTSTPIITPKLYIITASKHLEAVNKLAEWKRTKGFDVKISSKPSWVYIDIVDSILQTKSSVGIDYLLLVGDHGDVPGKFDAIEVNDTDYMYYTDYYYEYFGHNGCTSQYPGIAYGRIPVSTATESSVVVNKILNYETIPVTDTDFYDTGLHCAYFQDLSCDSYEDRRFVLTSEEIRNHMLQNGKNVDRVYYASQDVTPRYWSTVYGFNSPAQQLPNELLRENGFLWDGDSTQISGYINQGCHYVLFRDHGHPYRWGNPTFNVENIYNLHNGNKQPIVFSLCCWTGAFAQLDTCFAEAFLRKENGGAVGVYAAVSPSLSGYNDELALIMFDAIWPTPSFLYSFPNYPGWTMSLTNTPIYRLGDVLAQGLINMGSLYENYNVEYANYTRKIFHCFGDPTMDIRTEQPTHFRNVSVTTDNLNYYVSTTDTATVTFYNTITKDITSYCGTTVTHPYANGIRICLSAPNKIPYIQDGDTVCIQNETIAESTTYQANVIKVGRNVTSLKPVGDVYITNGQTTLIGNSIELNAGTTVSQGASLEIRNN